MRALLVNPRIPPTYWGFQHSLPIAGKKASLPPLGLLSLAALLPRSWELRIADENVRPVRDDELRWADAVLLTGMRIQTDALREVLSRARKLGRRTVVGGPAATTEPALFPLADHVFVGEAEGRIEPVVQALEAREPAPRVLSPAGDTKPQMEQVPVPRFDLLDPRPYASMSVQFSRGCPFQCEFCDIIEMFGRRPRTKSPEQILAELDALTRTGYRGTVFFVDDNFIGNRVAVAKLLPHVKAWQEKHGFPLEFYTEASVDLGTQEELVRSMVDAGFSSVFLGIESPSPESLKETHKLQNLRMPAEDVVQLLTRAGLEVYAGFIVGFDSDGTGIFDLQRQFISSLPIPMAMVGMLTALPGTQLERRLGAEGRLRHSSGGDQFDRPNFKPAMQERELVAGYRELLSSLYSPEAYYARCENLVREIGKPPRLPRARKGALGTVLRTLLHIGIASPRRKLFWKLIATTLRRAPYAIARAVALSIQGEHFIRYTREDVLPRLDRALAQIAAEPPVAADPAAPRAVLPVLQRAAAAPAN